MADNNINITPGTGKIVATDNVDGIHYQKFKLVAGGTGLSGSLVDIGQQTIDKSLPVVLPSSQITTLTPPTLTTLETLTESIKTAAEAIQSAVALLAKSTDTQPVDTGLSQPLTNDQLRASAISISDGGSSLTIDGSVTANTGLDQPLTDTQLRDSAVPVSLASLPEIPPGENSIGKVVSLGTTEESTQLPIACSDFYGIGLGVPFVQISDGNVSIQSIGGLFSFGSYDQSGHIWSGENEYVLKSDKISASSGDNTIVAAVSEKKICVLSLMLSFSGTVNAKFQSGTSGTDKTGLIYGVANSLVVLPYNKHGWFETDSGALLNLNLSGSVSVGGCLTYIEI